MAKRNYPLFVLPFDQSPEFEQVVICMFLNLISVCLSTSHCTHSDTVVDEIIIRQQSLPKFK